MYTMIRKILLLLALMAFLAGIGLPVMAGNHDLNSTIKKMEMLGKKKDDPWDPGDESTKIKALKKHVEKVSPGLESKSMLAKKKDDPWDPGDEMPSIKGGGGHV